MEQDFYRASDIAQLLGLTRSRVYQLIEQGVIPGSKIGGAYRVAKPAWQAFVAEQGELALANCREQASAN